MSRSPSPIRGLRWWIAGLLFLSTVINYIDRQTLNVLGPILQETYSWTKEDFAVILIAFRIGYTIMQCVSGRLLDWIGTYAGVAISVAFYSLVASLTATARSFGSLWIFRFLLGAGEASNWPGSSKAVSEWFPHKERAWAIALCDSGSSIGGAIAPFLVLFLYERFGSWQPAVLVTGMLGFLWLAVWIRFYHTPEKHPRISAQELEYIQQGRSSAVEADAKLPPVGWGQLLRYRQTWGIMLGRFLIDPYWFLVAEWFAIYLHDKGFDMEKSILGVWAPFLGADLGNFAGGGLSSYWISRGWPVGRARRTVLLIFGPSMLLLIPAAFTSDYIVQILLFSYATFAYAACSSMFHSLPTDAFHSRAVASVSGLGGTAAGIGTLVSTFLIGYVAERFSFEPIVIAASIIPCIATAVFVVLVRANKTPDPNRILTEF